MPFLVTGLTQLTKVFINYLTLGRTKLEDYFAWGGFPSSHIALAASLTTVVWLLEGILSASFAIALAFTVIVMRDAVGLRMFVEKQAKAINIIRSHTPALKKKLPEQKESVGHTVPEAWGGVLFGIAATLLAYIILASY